MSWFVTFCLYGALDIIYGLYTADQFHLYFGMACAALGINLSILNPLHLLIFIVSVIAGYFFPPYTKTIAIGLIPIALGTAFSLFTFRRK